jgi:hypothetical protein
MDFSGKPVDRASVKPLYVIVAEDPTEKEGIIYYVTKDMIQKGFLLEFRGFVVSKKQAEMVNKQKSIDVIKTKNGINRQIPAWKVITIDNVNYQANKNS